MSNDTKDTKTISSSDRDTKVIGNYRIIQKLGEGGMGEFYEAEQTEPIRRRVALKIIKWGMDTKQKEIIRNSCPVREQNFDRDGIFPNYKAGTAGQ